MIYRKNKKKKKTHTKKQKNWCCVFKGPEISSQSLQKFVFEPHHDKTNKVAYMPSEDSDQPTHPPSLIRDFTVHSMGS